MLSSLLFGASNVEALNITNYKDTLSDSGPGYESNHTLEFTLNTDVSGSGYIEVVPPSGFVISASSTFSERNVELSVNGGVRSATATPMSGYDGVEIFAGSPGLIRYTLAPDYSVPSGANLKLKIGNHTLASLPEISAYSTSTGTTTTPADMEPIKNSNTLGMHEVNLAIYDGGLVAKEKFVIFLNEKIKVPSVDTTETIPPYRFNPAPTSTVGGTTLSVEISLETDEFAWCRYSEVPGTDFNSMTEIFANTGLIYHSTVVAVTPSTVNRFYVRCIDDEGNYNIDDFLIVFTVNDIPTGTANTDGNVSGDGTGSGNDGSGDGSGSGGTTGDSSGEAPLLGGSSGTGGSGGGGGGGKGEKDGSSAGGGFEAADAPYPSGDAKVIISGYAYPDSKVGVLVDGNYFDTTTSNNVGVYSITLDQIARGVYTFGVYAEGPDKVRSSTFSTSFTVTGGRTSALGNVNISPSVNVEPDPVDVGQTVTFSGYTLANAEVTVENGRINSPSAKTQTVISDTSGKWILSMSTAGFTRDTYQVRAKAKQDGGESTHFSDYTFYGVGQEADVPMTADLNVDGKVNLTDFSILLFWWNSDGGDSSPPADINQDGKVSLTDFSILLFNWTG